MTDPDLIDKLFLIALMVFVIVGTAARGVNDD